MHYKNSIPPMIKNFKEMTRNEANIFFKWYLDSMPQRIKMLKSNVRSSLGYDDWFPNFEPNSLIKLGRWFFENIETRKKTEEEVLNSLHKLPRWFQKINLNEDWILTETTFSVSMDIGMYMGQTLIENGKDIEWALESTSKRSVNYNQPILSSIGKLSFNPTYLLITLAYGTVRRRKDKNSLFELYCIWSKILQS